MLAVNNINDLRMKEQEYRYENLRREADEWRLLRPIYAAQQARRKAAIRATYQRVMCQLQDLLGRRTQGVPSACEELSTFDAQTRRDVVTLSGMFIVGFALSTMLLVAAL